MRFTFLHYILMVLISLSISCSNDGEVKHSEKSDNLAPSEEVPDDQPVAIDRPVITPQPDLPTPDFNYYSILVTPRIGCVLTDCDVQPLWSSLEIPESYLSQNSFRTDATLSVRVRVNETPATCRDNSGKQITNDFAYPALGLTVSIRSADNEETQSAFLLRKEFGATPVQGCSPVHTFVDLPRTEEPLVIELYRPTYIPYDEYDSEDIGNLSGNTIHQRRCWSVTLDIATDQTGQIDNDVCD
ncbi:hypothetical protein OAB57_01900 [Bacteriovoracaceae bacterium]|nr:hypothetical protein [Bacteriovoracaceae bacterium]